MLKNLKCKIVDKLIDLSKKLYNLSDKIINGIPVHNQFLEIIIFMGLLVFQSVGAIYALVSLDFWFLLVMASQMACTLWIFVVMSFALEKMEKEEIPHTENCPTNLDIVQGNERHEAAEDTTG